MAQRFHTVGDSPSTETRSREDVNRMLRLLVSTDESNDGEVLPLAFAQSDVLPTGKGHRLKTHPRLAQQHFSNRCRMKVHQHRIFRPTPIETNHLKVGYHRYRLIKSPIRVCVSAIRLGMQIQSRCAVEHSHHTGNLRPRTPDDKFSTIPCCARLLPCQES